MSKQIFTTTIGGREVSVETGRIAKQANGTAWVRYGDTIVMATATMGEDKDVDFLPLTVIYEEKAYSAGKVPGSFFKREGRPQQHEVLFSRLIDRPLRPLFPDGYSCETQVFAYVMSLDETCPTDFPAMLATSLALYISDIPFATPVVGVRVGRIDGELVVNPSHIDMESSDLDLMVAVSDEGITMVEGGADFLSEEEIIEGLLFAQEQAKPILAFQHEIQKAIGKPKIDVTPPPTYDEQFDWLKAQAEADVLAAAKVEEKFARSRAFKAVKNGIREEFGEKFPDQADLFGGLFDRLKKQTVREMIRTGVRNDGRDWTTVRPIDIDLGLLPRAHGSSLFTRGETQAIVASTLGTTDDELKHDKLTGVEYQRFYLHYNFPPFSVGEARRVGSPGRREIGHGMLAERALARAVPAWDAFPYTIRIVSEITESNGSSSMASICGGCLAMMDAGIPVREPIAGVAMGLIDEGDTPIVLTDILGDEDHLGDMDFKVAGGQTGITALQMDIKIRGVDRGLLERAMSQAKEARMHILGEMNKSISDPRDDMSPFAPRFERMLISPDKIRDLIGPGGKMIRSICDETGAKIDIGEDGVVFIYAKDLASTKLAKTRIDAVVAVPEVGHYYEGLVKRTLDFGAFVEILPGNEGLVHISEIANERIDNVTDVIKEGEVIIVKILEIKSDGKVRLSRKAALDVTADQIDELNAKAE